VQRHQQQQRRRGGGEADEQQQRAAVQAEPVAQPTGEQHRNHTDPGKQGAQGCGLTRAVSEMIAQIHRRPGVEGLANYCAGERQQANQQECAAAKQRQQQRPDAGGRRLAGGKQVERIRGGLRMAALDA
jgi:hypothetical protein